MENPTRRRASAVLLAPLALTLPALAQEPRRGSSPAAVSVPGLPPETVSTHRIILGPSPLDFRARAGAIRLSDSASGAPHADLAYIAYERDTLDPSQRPVVFAINGGPGAASCWLGLGAIGPWRLRMGPLSDTPSAPPELIDNAETWLPFADLVLIDTVGTGYSKLLASDDGVRKHFYSVDGDVDALAVFVRKWLVAHNRMASPKFIVAESYGSIRAPRLIHLLSQRDNVGILGLILVSPTMDASKIEGSGLLAAASYLPTYAALTRKAKNRAALADVEAYAANEYLVDLLKGPRDADAQSRLAKRVSAITGLAESEVRLNGGRIDRIAFVRDMHRADGKVLSLYDGTVAGFDPDPTARFSEWDDPVLDTLRAPLGAAMTMLVAQTLKWPVGDARYLVVNDEIIRQWDWGQGGRRALESTTALRDDLASDPGLAVTLVHGLYDLVAPYFSSKMTLDQFPAFGSEGRVKLMTYPAGHMVYARDEGRIGLRDEARAMIGSRTASGAGR